MKKTSLSLLLSVMLLLLLLPTKVFADEGELVLSPEPGENKVQDIGGGEYYKSDFTSVTIEGSIDSIGDHAFYDCPQLTTVTIEGGVGTIGKYAFYDCPQLTTVTIEGSVGSIGESAFIYCDNLTTVTINGNVGTIGQSAFFDCDKLTTVTINGNVGTIGENAFLESENLKMVIDGSVDAVLGNAFFPIITRREFINFDGSKILRTIFCSSNIDYRDAIPNGPEKPSTEQYNYKFDGWEEKLKENTPNYYIYTPTYTEEVRKYAINFQNFDGTNLQNDPFEYNAVPTYNKETPTKAPDNQYTYTFAGWEASDGKVYGKNDSLPAVKGEATYTATYTSTLREYEVKFLDDDGTVLDSATFTYGTTPEFKGNPNPPVKEPDVQYTYTFAGWQMSNGPVCENGSFPAVKGDTTYTATYTGTLREYEIRFVDEEGKVLQADTLTYGEIPKYNGETPSKEPDAQYTYTFGWKASDGKVYGEKDALPAVGGDATYTVSFSETVNEYTITFVDEEGKELQSGKLAYGDTPKYNGETPTKEADAEVTYTFAGWETSDGTIYEASKSLPAVSGDETYTAAYTKTVNQYTVTFLDYDGKTVLQEATAYDYGTKASDIVLPKDPVRASDDEYTYEFSGWTPELKDVTANVVYTAVYSSGKQSYTITWLQEDGSLIDTMKVEYGEMPVHADPTKAADAQYTYTFAGWDKEIVKVTGDATYKATYSKQTKEYTITFVDEEGKELQSGKVAYGATPEYTSTAPTKEATVQYTYTFAGWKDSDGTVYGEGASLPLVTGDATYTVLFKEEERMYTIAFRIETPNVVSMNASYYAYGETPKYTGNILTRIDGINKIDTFAGWKAVDGDGTVYDNESLPPVTGDTVYISVYTTVKKWIFYTETQTSEGNWTKGSSDPIVMIIKRSENDEECFNHFVKVQIDEKDMEVSAEPGSTIITINAETLETLSVGEHTVTVLFDDGDPVEKKITIQAKPAESNKPQNGVNTGDNNHPELWISLLCLSVIGIGAVVKARKKRID
ncbi:MAG: leucine-rich repeat protein [Firmicutes bacterium]|nr:leucine-rich repeat protein [Bacillota bacterium]